jgi:hypothetical protein
MSVNYAVIETKESYLNSTFGRELAQLWLGLDNEMIESIVGRYSKGKRKGQLRGAIQWKKVIRGGWKHDACGGGHVELPGRVSDIRIIDAWTKETIFVFGGKH